MKSLLTLVAAAFLLLGCSKDDGVSGAAISGTPAIISAEGGYERVVVTWEHNTSSEESSYSNIYWDGGESYTGQALNSGSASTITLTLTLEDHKLSQGEHTFYVQNVNTLNGTASAESVPVTVYVYGEKYCSELAQSTIASTLFVEGDADGVGERVDITWGTAPSDAGFIGSRLYYFDRAGDEATKFCSKSEATSSVDNALTATDFGYAALYLPEGCIDTLVSTAVEGETFPSGGGVIRVASLKAMQPYFSVDNVHILLETGEYNITAADIKSGLYLNYGPMTLSVEDDEGESTGDSEIVAGDYIHSIFLVEGSGSTYDFGGSRVTIETLAYDVTGYESYPLRFIGNDNVVCNLELVDEGEAEYIHPNGITNVVMDGARNVVESLTLRSTGSYPYGYGELFGKGGVYTIKHYKHSGVLIRGDDNTLRDSDIYHYAYGHCVFVQGGHNVLIDNCYIEAEKSTSDAVIEEMQDPSSAAYGKLTQWGYEVPAGYSISLAEDGVRTYGSGNTIVDGVPYGDRTTTGITVSNTTVKRARGAFLTTFGTSLTQKVIENCTAIECDRGFSVGTSGVIRNCYSDAKHGGAFIVEYQERDQTVDVTITDYEGETYNGSKHAAFLMGNNQSVILRKGEGLVEDMTLIIDCGGQLRRITDLSTENPGTDADASYYLTSSTVYNQTSYRTDIAVDSKGNTIYTNGPVYIYGCDNTIYTSLAESTVMDSGTGNTVICAEWEMPEKDE